MASLDRLYKVMASFQYTGERIFYTFASLYADLKGATPAQIGVMLSLQNILAFIGQQYFGKSSDKVGRPLIIGFGWIVSIICSFMIFNFVDPILIIATFALYNIGYSMVQPAWNALIGDSFPANIRAKQLGVIGAAATLFGGLLYLAAGLLSSLLFKPFSFLFIVAGVCFCIAFVMVVFLSKTSRIPEREVIQRDGHLSVFDPLQRHLSFRKFVLIDTTFAMSMSLSWPLFPHATNNLANPSQVAIIWFATFLSFSFTARYNTQIKRYIGKYSHSFFISRMLMFLVPLTFAFATSWVHILLVRIISGGSFGFYSIVQKDYILETCEQLHRTQDRGWFLGSHAFVWGILTFFGSLFSGFIAEYFIVTHPGIIGYSGLFIVASIARFVTVSLYFLVPSFESYPSILV